MREALELIIEMASQCPSDIDLQGATLAEIIQVAERGLIDEDN